MTMSSGCDDGEQEIMDLHQKVPISALFSWIRIIGLDGFLNPGDLVIKQSMDRHSKEVPSISSYSASPYFQNARKIPEFSDFQNYR